MAEFFWAKTYRVASAGMFAVLGVLALLDRFTRPQFADGVGGDAATAMTVLALGLGLAGLVSLVLPFERWSESRRLVPAALGIVALVVAVTIGQATDHPAVAIGLSLTVVVILAQVGLLLRPGVAIAVAPAPLLILLALTRTEADRISLALPLVAVPVAAVLAEVLSALSSRSSEATTRSDARLRQLARLEEVLRRFRRPGSLQKAAIQVANAALEIFEVDRATVVLRDSRGQLIPVTVGPLSDREPDPRAAELVVETISGDEPRLVATGTNGTMLVLPLPTPDVPAGAVLVYPVPTDDPEFTLDLARLFGVQVGIAIEHLFVIDELARATTVDELTGIGNRRHADALLRSLQPGDALVLLDLDGFKSVNDTLGHSAGDTVLQQLSAHLRDCLRDSDTSARLGGDEFLIVARRAHADPLAVAHRVLEGWADKRGMTTLSAGVALHESGPSTQDTFERADRALYQAKEAGKNRAHLWLEPEDVPT